MSFILDALRKSENDRHRGTGPSFADVKSAGRARRVPILWLAIGALLLVNVAALIVLLVRRGDPAQVSTPTMEPQTSAAQPAVPRTAEPVGLPAAPVASPLPAAAAPSASTLDYATQAEPPREPLLDRPQLTTYASDQNLPTMNDVLAQGRARLPDLHLEMHVYAAAAEQRFVSINSRKYHEGMQIDDALRIERITPDGVILNQRGLRFLLPRQ
ncbi:MAG TPA: general secretion pathway protein GspB [Steroidobacteraceae bacterium]|nr:general secretion pathway protein GspB [Steroidobacteraceae bacterium]